MFVVIGEDPPQPGAEAAFEASYGVSGAWDGLFRKHVGDIGTRLLHDERPYHYLTIDFIDRRAPATGYALYRDTHPVHHAHSDALGDALARTERRIGRYETPC